MRGALACTLVVEMVLSASWLAGRLPMLAAYGVTTLAMIGLRGGLTALQAAAAFALAGKSAGAPRLAGMAFALGALTLTLELGARLSPSNVFPSYRWPIVAAYWAYALLCTWAVRRLHRS